MTSPHRAHAGEHGLEARARAIRAGLPGQLRQQRSTTAALLYGPLRSFEQLRLQIAHSIPRRPGYIRLAKLETIEQTEVVIPDEILAQYDDALDHGLFARFMVGRPTYYWSPQPCPWLVAVVAETERWVTIARWDATASP